MEDKPMKAMHEELKGWDKGLPLGRYLALLGKTFFGALSKRLEHLGLERSYSILLLIEGAKDNCCQQYISDYLKIDKASMVKRLDYLAKEGLIERKINPADRREHNIVLTAKGMSIMPEIHKAVEEVNNEATKGLSQEETEKLYSMLDIMYRNLQELPAHKFIVNYKKAS